MFLGNYEDGMVALWFTLPHSEKLLGSNLPVSSNLESFYMEFECSLHACVGFPRRRQFPPTVPRTSAWLNWTL